MSGKDFQDFVVVVTGASTGLGRAIAVETASRGAAAVIINYASSADEAAETARQVEAHGAKPVIVQGDVASDDDCRRIAAAAQPFGRIDALFNNAGVTKFAPNHADLDAVTAEDFLRLYSVNVVGAYQMVRAARSLLEAGPQVVLLTDGGAGVHVLTPTAELAIDVPRVAVVDTVGAGDSFGGGFLHAWCSTGLDRTDLGDLDALRTAVEFAVRVAALTCQRQGAEPPFAAEL